MLDKDVSPAVAAARSGSEKVLRSGARIRVGRVPQILVSDAVSRVDPPEIPMWWNEDKQRNEPNPNSPSYLREVELYEKDQSQAAIDACILWGVELLDPVPDPATWLPKIKFMAKRGHLSIDGYDLDDPLELEFLYKRYVAVDADEIGELMKEMVEGVTPEDLAKARDSFRDTKK